MFTARYGLIPYMKQITSRLQKAKYHAPNTYKECSCICTYSLILAKEAVSDKLHASTTLPMKSAQVHFRKGAGLVPYMYGQRGKQVKNHSC